MILYFGSEITLSNGEKVTLVTGVDGLAFVRYPYLIDIEVKTKNGPEPIGKGYCAWVDATKFTRHITKDGAVVGLQC